MNNRTARAVSWILPHSVLTIPALKYNPPPPPLGESFRPVVPRWMVRMAYGVTWAYVAVDVTYHTAEEHEKGSAPMTVLRTAVHAATFQSIASVLVPSIVIHQVTEGAFQPPQLPPNSHSNRT